MRKLLALPFGLIFVGLLVLSLTLVSLSSFAFDPAFYTRALNDRGVFQDFERDPLKYVDLARLFSQLKTLSTDTQRQIITAALPPGWLEQTLKNALRDIFTWLESDSPPPPDLMLDLRPIKDRLQGPPGRLIAEQVVAAIPTCAAGQTPQLSLDRLPECWPGNLDRALIIDQVAVVLDTAASNVSPSIDLGRQLIPTSMSDDLLEVRRWAKVAMGDTDLLVIIAATGLVWLLGALLGGRSASERWTWLGGWLLFGTLLAVAVYALIFVGGSRAMLTTNLISMPDGWAAAATSAVRYLAATTLQQLALRAIVPVAALLIVSVALLGAGAASRKSARF